MGSAINMYHAEDSRYNNYFKKEHSVLVAEYECKMNIIQKRKRGEYDMSRCILAF